MLDLVNVKIALESHGLTISIVISKPMKEVKNKVKYLCQSIM